MKHVPNILTILRLLACPFIIYLFRLEEIRQEQTLKEVGLGITPGEILGAEGNLLIILIIFLLASLTDFFDGYLAREKNLKSSFGKILDPIADKALIITMCIMIIIGEAIWPASYNSSLHYIPFCIIIFREIIVSLLRYNIKNNSNGIQVTRLSKYKTFIQMLAIATILFHDVSMFPFEIYKNIYQNLELTNIYIFFENLKIFLIWFAAFVTLITGIQHLKTYKKLK